MVQSWFVGVAFVCKVPSANAIDATQAKQTYCTVVNMKLLLSLLPVGMTLLLRSTQAQCPSLLWNDEFDGSSLDTTKWTPQIGDGCALGQDLCGWGNNELQWYREENAIVSDGTLKIIAREQDFNNYDFTSARIRTVNKADFDLTQGYLRLEARIKVPDAGNGIWPAFWMLPSDRAATAWPTGGEVSRLVLVRLCLHPLFEILFLILFTYLLHIRLTLWSLSAENPIM